jgi:hypothetical protein
VISLRTSDELAEKLATKAEAEGLSRNDLIVRYCEHGLRTEGLGTLLLSVSQIACLDQLAARAGMTRMALIQRYLSERLRREFVDDRNDKLQSLTRDRAGTAHAR